MIEIGIDSNVLDFFLAKMALKAALENLAPKSVFITGANRGIGLNFVKHLLDLPKPPCHIFTTCRDPSKAQVPPLSLMFRKFVGF